MGGSLIIHLALWESNYYKWPVQHLPRHENLPPEEPLKLRQVYLRYQDPLHPNATFEIDNSALTENGFTCCDTYPKKFSGDMLTLTSTDPLCIKVYSDSLTNHLLVVGLGQSFGKHWIQLVFDESTITPRPSWEDYAEHKYHEMLVRTPESVRNIDESCFADKCSDGLVCIMQNCLP